MRRGRCELCHAEADLRDSHYLPKSGYRKMRASQLTNPNPVVLSGGKAKQSPLQVSDYKFCTDCEDRLNRGGEAWILGRVSRNYGDPFWLHTLLRSKTPISSGDDLLFPQAAVPEVDMAKLVYFALSIFWRGTCRWSPVEGGRPEMLYLGRHESAIRSFLLGRAKLPVDIAVTVAVWPYEKVYPAALMPRPSGGFGHRGYWFYYFGFVFLLAVGRKIPARVRRTCSYHSPEKFLTLSLELGRIAKEAMRRNLLSLDRSKIEATLKEVDLIRLGAPRTGK